MPKHRQAGFAVVRECLDPDKVWKFSGLIGVYFSTDRADEVAAATIQKYLDAGMSPDDPECRCTVHPTNYYDE
jgi:hypothetical protein